MTTIIVGAGASGLACAVRLKQNNPLNEVIILERMPRTGKKLLATGNGRCNLSNEKALYKDETVSFFESIGIVTRTDGEGRIYPYSNTAVTIVDALTEKCLETGVKIITDCKVTDIEKNLVVKTTKGNFNGDNVVIAAGGKAQSSLGSDGSGYDILKKLGHTITPLSPALVQLTSPSKYPRKLKGHRVKCKMTLLLDGEKVAEEYGEVLFTDYGLSGIVTMNLSGIAGKNFANENPQKCHAVLDLVPEMTENDLKNHIEKFGSLQGILGKPLAEIIAKQAQGDALIQAQYAKNWKLIINGTKGFDFAQITSGGADTNEFDNFQSRFVKNLYACGEILNCQYPCGGFNLDFAWHSGIAVADQISKS